MGESRVIPILISEYTSLCTDPIAWNLFIRNGTLLLLSSALYTYNIWDA